MSKFCADSSLFSRRSLPVCVGGELIPSGTGGDLNNVIYGIIWSFWREFVCIRGSARRTWDEIEFMIDGNVEIKSV